VDVNISFVIQVGDPAIVMANATHVSGPNINVIRSWNLSDFINGSDFQFFLNVTDLAISGAAEVNVTHLTPQMTLFAPLITPDAASHLFSTAYENTTCIGLYRALQFKVIGGEAIVDNLDVWIANAIPSPNPPEEFPWPLVIGVAAGSVVGITIVSVSVHRRNASRSRKVASAADK